MWVIDCILECSLMETSILKALICYTLAPKIEAAKQHKQSQQQQSPQNTGRDTGIAALRKCARTLFGLDSSFSCFRCTLAAGCHFLCLQSGSFEVVCVWLSPLCSLRWVQPQGFGRPASFALSPGAPGSGLLHGLHNPSTATVKMFEVDILQGWWASLYHTFLTWEMQGVEPRRDALTSVT